MTFKNIQQLVELGHGANLPSNKNNYAYQFKRYCYNDIGNYLHF